MINNTLAFLKSFTTEFHGETLNFNVPFVNMDSYLIRIYRRDKKNPEAIIGIIEEIGAEKKAVFCKSVGTDHDHHQT